MRARPLSQPALLFALALWMPRPLAAQASPHRMVLAFGPRIAPLEDAGKTMGYELRALVRPGRAARVDLGAAITYAGAPITSGTRIEGVWGDEWPHVKATTYEAIAGLRSSSGRRYWALRLRGGAVRSSYQPVCGELLGCPNLREDSGVTATYGIEAAYVLQLTRWIGLELTGGLRRVEDPGVIGLRKDAFSGSNTSLLYRVQF